MSDTSISSKQPFVKTRRTVKVPKKYRHLSYNSRFVSVFRFIIISTLMWLVRIRTFGLRMNRIKPPYVLLAQHSSMLDPIIYNQSIKLPLHFIVSDAQFRLPLMRFILGLVGSITKKKAGSDVRTISEIMHVVKKRGESIAVFPEGVNTWDGTSLDIVPSTVKLIKHLKLPVITAKSHGAFLSFPRWARGIRRGVWNVYFTPFLLPEHIKSLSEAEILSRIQAALSTNEYASQRGNRINFVSSRAAEYIERVLFACPCCNGIQSLVSHKSVFHCTMCCNMWRVGADGFIRRRPTTADEGVSSGTRDEFQTISSWNAWQLKLLRQRIKDSAHDMALFTDAAVRLRYGVRRPVIDMGVGTLSLTKECMKFIPCGKKKNMSVIIIPATRMRNTNVQNNEKLEWTNEHGIIYQVQSVSPRGNMYKYMQAVSMLQGYPSAR